MHRNSLSIINVFFASLVLSRIIHCTKLSGFNFPVFHWNGESKLDINNI